MNESKNQNTTAIKKAAIVNNFFFIRLIIYIVNSTSDKTTYPATQSLDNMNDHRPPPVLQNMPVFRQTV